MVIFFQDLRVFKCHYDLEEVLFLIKALTSLMNVLEPCSSIAIYFPFVNSSSFLFMIVTSKCLEGSDFPQYIFLSSTLNRICQIKLGVNHCITKMV